MPKVKPNRLRDRLRRAVQARPGQIVAYSTLGWLLYPRKMGGERPVDPFSPEVAAQDATAEVKSLLSDTMRSLRDERPEEAKNYHTVRGKGYIYLPPHSGA